MAHHEEGLIEEAFEQRPLSRQTAARLWEFARPYRRTVGLNLLMALAATLSLLLGPKLIQVGLDRFLTDVTDREMAYQGLLLISGLYLGNLLLGWAASVAQVRSAVRVGQLAMNDLRMRVFQHIQTLSLNYFDRTHQGRIIARADTDIASLDQVLTWGASQLVVSFLTLLGAIALMLGYDWRLCAAVVGIIPAMVLATWWFQTAGMQAHRRLREQSSRITSSLAEMINGVRVVQSFSREEENLSRFIGIHEEYSERFMGVARVFHTYMPFLGAVFALGSAIILGYGGSLALRGEISVGELAAFLLYLGMFFGPIQAMGELYNASMSAAASAERIFQLLDTKPQVVDLPGVKPLPRLMGGVRFEQVFFRYDTTPEERWVLKDISFEVSAGSTVALVGKTGSGKTSIASLLARFYEPQRGQIFVDEVALNQGTVESLRSQIAIVTQENFLFSGSVMDNLRFAKPEASEEEIVRAAKLLGSDEIIRRLAKGYETAVSERGANFSLGERQLICLTRAMVAEPRILILDEATSAVDPPTEEIIQHALEKLFEKCTCFAIAHRLSTVQHASRIFVLESGEIVERGTHDELLQLRGRYAQLHTEFCR